MLETRLSWNIGNNYSGYRAGNKISLGNSYDYYKVIYKVEFYRWNIKFYNTHYE